MIYIIEKFLTQEPNMQHFFKSIYNVLKANNIQLIGDLHAQEYKNEKVYVGRIVLNDQSYLNHLKNDFFDIGIKYLGYQDPLIILQVDKEY